MNLEKILKQAFKDNTNSQGVTFQPRFIDQALTALENLEKEVTVDELYNEIAKTKIKFYSGEPMTIALALKDNYKITKREE